MKSAQKYTKEQFVRDFLEKQALAKALRMSSKSTNTSDKKITSIVDEVEVHDPTQSIVDIEESASAILDKYDNSVKSKGTNDKVDLTDEKEVFETKAIENDSNDKIIELNPIKSSVKESNTKIKSKEDIKSIVEKEMDSIKSNKTNIFEVEIKYSSNDLSFSGIKLVEEELKDGNLQVGFDVDAGTFVGNTITKVVRKRKPKVKSEEVCAQLTFN